MKNVDREQVVMRFELTPERVLVYVPALIQAVFDMFGDSLSHWKTKDGVGLQRVLARSLYEYEQEEIVADLSGLTPSIMDFRIGKEQWKPKPDKVYFPPGVMEWRPEAEEEPDRGEKPGEIWWWNKTLVRDVVAGWEDNKGPEAFAMDLINGNQIALNHEWTQERVIDYFRNIYKKIEEFFAP
jgi:hypothetical protein